MMHRALNQLPRLRPGSGMRRRSACAGSLVHYEGDLHDHPELGDLVVLHHGLELLDPDGRDVADRAGCALDRLADRVLVALRGLARQFDELRNGHGCLLSSFGLSMVRPERLRRNAPHGRTGMWQDELLSVTVPSTWMRRSKAPRAPVSDRPLSVHPGTS